MLPAPLLWERGASYEYVHSIEVVGYHLMPPLPSRLAARASQGVMLLSVLAARMADCESCCRRCWDGGR